MKTSYWRLKYTRKLTRMIGSRPYVNGVCVEVVTHLIQMRCCVGMCTDEIDLYGAFVV